MNEEKLKEFGKNIAMLIAGQDIDRPTAAGMFRQVLLDEQPALQQGAFLAALCAKGETAEEIAGAWEAIYEYDTRKCALRTSTPAADNSGTGMDSFKTFNISTVAGVIAAAGGVCLARHGSRALTSVCGAVDIAETLGVDVECDVDTVQRSIETAGIGLFNGMSAQIHPTALFRILAQIRFGSTLNIAASLANPALPRYGVRGVYSREMVMPVAAVMKEIGYRRALVVYGTTGDGRGMDEISTLGCTYWAELKENGEVVTGTLEPGLFGTGTARPEELAPAADRIAEAGNVIAVLSGQDHGAKSDIACLNAAPLFYITGIVDSIREGYMMAREVIETGRALEKLREWVKAQNRDSKAGLEKLDKITSRVLA